MKEELEELKKKAIEFYESFPESRVEIVSEDMEKGEIVVDIYISPMPLVPFVQFERPSKD